MLRAKGMVVAFWVATAPFCLQMGITAYAQPPVPAPGVGGFTHLGFPTTSG